MKQLIIIVILVLLTGCITVNEEMLRKASISPPQNQSVIVEVKTGELIQKLNGEGQNRGVLSGKTVLNAVAESMMAHWKYEDLIEDYGSPGELEKEPDYTLTISGVRNEDGSIAGAVLSGLTLLIIPTSSTLTYDLDIDFVNNHTQKHYYVKAKNAVTTWMQILLLPAFPFAWIGANNSMNDIADYVYYDLNRQGAFNDLSVTRKSSTPP